MSDSVYQIIALTIYMAAMLFIGWYAFRKTDNLKDYMLGGRGLGAAVGALSAGAADMSGWLLMGLPGAIYAAGLVEAWIAVGLTIGAYLNWFFVAPRLRVYSFITKDSITIPSFLENRLKDNSRILRVVSGIIILVFFTFYVSSGMVAGGVFFQSSFGLNYHLGLVLVSGVVVAYTLFGGFLAVSYTDVVQGLMMFLALIAVPIIGVFATGGLSETAASIREVDPALLNFTTGASLVGVISALAWGLGYFGQPHIIVRFMAINSLKEVRQARRIGISWMILSLAGAITTALIGLAYFQQNPNLTLGDPEGVFIVLGQIFFHPLVAGFMLAAVLAAIMSTISSQLIVTSSALVEDLYKIAFKKTSTDKQYVSLGRLAVLVISLIAAALAWKQDSSILDLVAYAWAGFGAAFGPLILLALFWRKLTTAGALAGMVVGAVSVIVWDLMGTVAEDPGATAASNFIGSVYEIIPGFFLCLIVTVIVSLITHKADKEITAEFDETVRLIKERA
ncbi:sodium/proline symporter PutP [Planococcus sp. N028]|uniref:Sodium/proline symporter n=1 Tax=Planococcus shixiaomingii TaxID=3058393 RepID=A0ABT8N6D5_9BACL|nr:MULTISPECIES: sodium/proline symporter PutP [unclassified Planococcus (in: firmicutes)]MDN7243293.1 sodium/proline symporter PutP [Planococcus sp. N028]WKA55235.1 sodium/proline symporter PutP [Planococcus sp. N022]